MRGAAVLLVGLALVGCGGGHAARRAAAMLEEIWRFFAALPRRGG